MTGVYALRSVLNAGVPYPDLTHLQPPSPTVRLQSIRPSVRTEVMEDDTPSASFLVDFILLFPADSLLSPTIPTVRVLRSKEAFTLMSSWFSDST